MGRGHYVVPCTDKAHGGSKARPSGFLDCSREKPARAKPLVTKVSHHSFAEDKIASCLLLNSRLPPAPLPPPWRRWLFSAAWDG